MAVDEHNNVTYVNFGTRKKVTAPEEVLKVDRVHHGGSALNPAATRLVALMSKQVDSGRLKRGTDYARQGHVVGLDVRNGAVHGRVAGSQNEPFAVLIQLPYRSNDQLGEIAEILARTPNSMRDAREGSVAPAVLDIIYGEDERDVRFSCTCPDPHTVCKHVVAVVDRLAARIDADPTVLFALRGLSIAQLEHVMVSKAQEASQDFASADPAMSAELKHELFWQGRELPDVPATKTAPALGDSDMELLKKALRSVTYTNLELLRAVSDVEELYEFLTQG